MRNDGEHPDDAVAPMVALPRQDWDLGDLPEAVIGAAGRAFAAYRTLGVGQSRRLRFNILATDGWTP